MLLWLLLLYFCFIPTLISYALNVKFWRLIAVCNFAAWVYVLDYISPFVSM